MARLPEAEFRALADRGRVWTKLDLARTQGAIADTTGYLGADTLAFRYGALELEIVDAVTGRCLVSEERVRALRGSGFGPDRP
ncbi:hypothetical protein SAMN05421783_11798 [Thiocapsa roseopersicina]|uniref:Uncharacterized protein n=1 Tax=Thiocapsa roseopersicina TaxID=1058 RepID=A0A1H2ZXM8_THIRO|nr:hypothetical protein SAMN05421783_11798 [Thiocapsa roseopersicina]